jgi:predicted branched-subunit amino acid permease
MTTLTLPAADRRGELRAGARAMAPLAIGYLPFALLVGAAVAASTDPVAAWAATPAVYGGSVHLTILQMLRDGSGLAITVAVGALMNARLLVYSTALAPDWAGAPVRTRLLVAASVIDPSWLIADRRAAGPGGIAERRAHYTGAAVTLAAAWTTGVTAGALLGAAGPALTELAAAVPLCLVAVVAPHVRVPGGGLAVLAAGLTAVLARGLPPGFGLLLCMAAAAAAGLAGTAGRSPC